METQTVDPQTVQPELNLLLTWPDERGHRWRATLGASLLVHLLLFFAAIKLPAFVRLASPPEPHTVIVRRTPLYLPRDVLTQRAPNRNRLSKQIDLADLLASQASPARPSTAPPKPRRFELTKQTTPPIAKNAAPQITAEPPSVALNEAPAPTVPAPIARPTPPENPFQNIAPQPHKSAKLAAPKSAVQAAIEEAHGANRKVAISDDAAAEPLPGSPGSIERPPAQHAAIELQSDPQGTDFKPYLARILAIVRSNWRTVIPESVRMGTRRGRTVIEFAINRDGSIPKLVIADPSGSEPLDRAAVAGLSMSNPLPPLPPDYKGLQVRLAFSFAYNMPAQ